MRSNRKVVFICRTGHNTTAVWNFDGPNVELNSFLHCFDIWGSRGHNMECSDGNHVKVFFECSREFFDMAMTDDFVQAFRRLGVEVTYAYEDIMGID